MLLYHYLYVNIYLYVRVRSLFLCTTSSVRRLYYTAYIYTSHTRRLYTYILSKFFRSWRCLWSGGAGPEGNRDLTRRGHLTDQPGPKRIEPTVGPERTKGAATLTNRGLVGQNIRADLGRADYHGIVASHRWVTIQDGPADQPGPDDQRAAT